MRGVIDPGVLAVSARDRLYLAGRVPTLIVWGDDDRIIPVDVFVPGGPPRPEGLMEGIWDLAVPLKVNVASGPNWAEAH